MDRSSDHPGPGRARHRHESALPGLSSAVAVVQQVAGRERSREHARETSYRAATLDLQQAGLDTVGEPGNFQRGRSQETLGDVLSQEGEEFLPDAPVHTVVLSGRAEIRPRI